MQNEDKDLDTTQLRIQVEVLGERTKYLEERLREQGQELEKAYYNLGRKEVELRQRTDERDTLRIDLEVTKLKLRHAEELLTLNNSKAAKKNSLIKRQAFFASILFLLATLLASLGTNFLTSSPPNPLGWLIISLSAVAYIIAALMTTIFALGGEN